MFGVLITMELLCEPSWEVACAIDRHLFIAGVQLAFLSCIRGRLLWRMVFVAESHSLGTPGCAVCSMAVVRISVSHVASRGCSRSSGV